MSSLPSSWAGMPQVTFAVVQFGSSLGPPLPHPARESPDGTETGEGLGEPGRARHPLRRPSAQKLNDQTSGFFPPSRPHAGDLGEEAAGPSAALLRSTCFEIGSCPPPPTALQGSQLPQEKSPRPPSSPQGPARSALSPPCPPLLPLSPPRSLALLQPRGPPRCPCHTPGGVPPQDLCTDYSACSGHPSSTGSHGCLLLIVQVSAQMSPGQRGPPHPSG